MKYLAVLGRQPEISIAELSAQLPEADFWTGPAVAVSPTILGFRLRAAGDPPAPSPVHISRFGGILKLAVELIEKPLDYLAKLPEGKITIGVSDYSKGASKKTATIEALKLKKILVRHGRSVRVVENKDAVLSTATSLHNGLSGKNEKKVELIKVEDEWYRVIGVQDIDAYAKRDQARPARDAKVGMLPPKLAQVLINLCGPLNEGSMVLDPFCGTGVVLQEALLMGYKAYGTDISERMVEYSEKNLKYFKFNNFVLDVGDATNYKWIKKIDAVACEGYLGKPFSRIPSDIELREQKQECGSIVLGFLRNLAGQIKKDTPVVIAVPAWLRPDNSYERLDILDEIKDLGYNVNNKSREGLLYHRPDQIVARDIIILRKK
ncbi:methyltransferase domain-containing protein [Candidatus Saccharibacteria bacterium]|nr:methyltransferase domain-containing protein [Candidatus Saccharibacteria bacterium]